MKIPGLITEGPYAGKWYLCRWCYRARAVGTVNRCKAPGRWSPTPWGPACEPDAAGVQTIKGHAESAGPVWSGKLCFGSIRAGVCATCGTRIDVDGAERPALAGIQGGI